MAENIRSIKFMSPQEQAVVDKLLKIPKMEPILNRLAETMDRELPQIIQTLSNMKPGDVFEETGQSKLVENQMLTGKTETVPTRRYKLLAPALPFKAPVLARMVSDLARQEFSTPTDTAMMLYHDDAEDGAFVAFYAINMRDFCKMFALGEWRLVTDVVMINKEGVEDEFEQKGILDPVAGIDSEVSKIIRP